MKFRSGHPVIQAFPGMQCTITVHINNTSDRAVHVGVVDVPFAGPHTGAAIEASSIDGTTPLRFDDYGRDGAHDLKRTVAAGQHTAFDIVLGFHPQGCDEGGTMYVRGWPTIDMQILGRTRPGAASNTLAVHQVGSGPGCRRASGQ